jgi:TRAP-type C4-dicarboxylate transport system permease small subunit
VSALRIVAVLLIAAGVVALVYGGITYTKTTHDAKLGPIELSIKDKETVRVPVWAGAGAIAVGSALLLVRRKQ